MARLSENPDRDFCAGYGKVEKDLYRLLSELPAKLEELFDNPVVSERVGRLIANAMHKSDWD